MAAAVLAGCSRNGEAQKATQAETSAAQETVKADGQEKETEAETEAVELATGRHHVKIEVKDYSTISVELYGDEAPISVTNFLKLAGDGFYDGLTFHRIISGFMIQGGDPQGTGMGGSDEMIKGEFSANGVNNPLKHTRGAISMARSQYPDSASSQFFIVHQDSTRLDGQYAAFGYVTEGMDVVDKLCEDTPVQDGNGTVAKEDQPVIERIEVVD
ncbi:MAG: peptidylprolyl isomerase [Clostridium sp.]|nr:peptidylprolyl isomerase [Clostridium sp.]